MDTSSEQYREQCEVRQIIRSRVEKGLQWCRDHLDGIEKKRGKPAADKIKSLIATQWALGNRGEKGTWL